MNSEHFSFVNTGSVMIMVVFLCLCLMTFSVLSVSSARSDYDLSVRSADYRTAYYEATDTSEEVILALRSSLSGVRGDAAACRAALQKAYEAGTLALPQDVVLVFDEDQISWQIPVSGSVLLQTEAQLSADGQLRVTACYTCSDGDWEADDTLNVIQ